MRIPLKGLPGFLLRSSLSFPLILLRELFREKFEEYPGRTDALTDDILTPRAPVGAKNKSYHNRPTNHFNFFSCQYRKLSDGWRKETATNFSTWQGDTCHRHREILLHKCHGARGQIGVRFVSIRVKTRVFLSSLPDFSPQLKICCEL